jgi:hypothetical protein
MAIVAFGITWFAMGMIALITRPGKRR